MLEGGGGGHMNFYGERRHIIGVWGDNLGERDHSEYKRIAGKIILTWIIKNRLVWSELDSSGSGYEQYMGFCVYTIKPSSSIKCRELHNYLSILYLLRKGSVP
jgi:hypothetical protein